MTKNEAPTFAAFQYAAHLPVVEQREEILPTVPQREQIERLEALMREMPQVDIPVEHRFAPGLYAREITIPADTLLTGLVHRQGHINIVSKGEITVWTEEGMQRVKAPCTIVSSPGCKRVGYTHAETVWTTILATDLTSIEDIERELVLPMPTEAEARALLTHHQE